ncbi:MAG TPA: hypothetical protein V6C95_09330 [Coleofasciculaceae cyanobacterium]
MGHYLATTTNRLSLLMIAHHCPPNYCPITITLTLALPLLCLKSGFAYEMSQSSKSD